MAQQTEKEKVVLEATPRAPKGTQGAQILRREGSVPGVVYGEGAASIPIHVGAKELGRALHTKAGGNVLITLRMKEDSKKGSQDLVLIKELQHHPVSHQIIHVDFHRVSLTKRITITVRLAFKGEAAGVRQAGGILEHIRWDLEVECLPTQIPPEIPIDVSRLELNQTLAAKAVILPEGVRLVTDPELPVVSCVLPKVEEVAAPAAEAAAEVAEPEVLKQKKPEEIAAEEEAKAKEKEKPEGKG
ncbi:MAG: 50S ribosomal protein L25 [Candidatus Omnitrophica bacterium]|nr:50S ribosomal protein L25 [Candidatus Omnitrophota bacterium]